MCDFYTFWEDGREKGGRTGGEDLGLRIERRRDERVGEQFWQEGGCPGREEKGRGVPGQGNRVVGGVVEVEGGASWSLDGMGWPKALGVTRCFSE